MSANFTRNKNVSELCLHGIDSSIRGSKFKKITDITIVHLNSGSVDTLTAMISLTAKQNRGILNPMPRVVQVPSSETEDVNVNVFNAESSDSESEETVNRNFNQTVNYVFEPLTSYLRFPINYSLYNVIYEESENEPYCLSREINGQVKKFKKDARTWLHKSSDRKRKMCEESLGKTSCESNAISNKNLKLLADAQHIIGYGGTHRSGQYRTDINNDLLSDISSLGDSEADLTYSEESSPSVTSETREKYQKSVRFNDTVNTGYRVHTMSSDSDESLNAVGKKTSTRSNVFQDESEILEKNDNSIDAANESRNNIRPGPLSLDVSKIAPAVSIEIDSLQESLLDYAVNMNTTQSQSNTAPSDTGPTSKYARYIEKRKVKYKKRRQDFVRPYNLRSTKKFSPPLEELDQVVPTSEQDCLRKISFKTADVKPAAASTDLAQPREFLSTDQKPSCSLYCEDRVESSSVPKLFVLAGHVLYTHLKSNFNKIN